MSSWNKKNDDENEEKASTSSAKSQRIEKLAQENELDELYGYQEPEAPVSNGNSEPKSCPKPAKTG